MDGGKSSETPQAPKQFREMAHRIETPEATPRLGWGSRLRSGIGRVASGLVRLNENATGIKKPNLEEARDPGYVARQIATEMRGLPVTGPRPFTEEQLLKSAFYFTNSDLRNPDLEPIISGVENSLAALVQSGQLEHTTYTTTQGTFDGFGVLDMQALQDRARNWELRQKANNH